MVDEIHEPSGEAQNSSRRDSRNEGILPWLTRLLVGMLGLSAAARYLLTTPALERAVTVPEEAPLPDEEEVHHPDGRIEHPHIRFEHTDASLGWILAIGITSMALAALIFYLLLWFFFDYKNYQAVIKRSPFPLAPRPSEALPAPPHLEQLNRIAEIERSNVYERQAGKESLLESSGLALPDLMVLGPSVIGLGGTSPAVGPLAAALAVDIGMTLPENGFVRIPIQQAMAWIVRTGKLPARQQSPASERRKENGLLDAGESNSGRMFRKEPRWYSR
jgi:hypothetical protein